ncbi:2-polyprenyl-6-methoxyphenol hydroxylase-like oxidoreductase [Nitrosotalea sinensis]|uniref:2-polyprenyl-6-methoxyphenol hydroxylase-like oxidoreductase n=2 Tax=Nitrosotalea sinensis TaxID=1499975 RepID=A0A2H1EFF7_9ARCH|nr:2-polyprenyl-6-methoxyphenol hydroxylase-like oxidoreductase [Candidatus Nitrosotalea sinensis]
MGPIMERKHALVIGGSISGLVSAQILAKYFEIVTIIEKDDIKSSDVRNGTPQANHIHTLLVKGKQVLSEIFPELEKEMMESGALGLDYILNGQYFIDGYWTPRFSSGLDSYFSSRTLFEFTIRKQVEKNNKIQFMNGLVTGLVTDNNKHVSVKIKSGKDFSSEQILHGDIVVDASGRNSKTSEWLQDIGYAKPEETHVDSNIGYATRCYKIPKEYQNLKEFIVILNHPPHQPKMGGILPIEGKRWKVTMYSIGKDLPTTDEKEFLEFSRTLADQRVYDMIKNAEPESEIHGYRVRGSRVIHYERAKVWPENYIVIGDAVCTFNPFYGQGMTIAVLGCKLLDEFLKKNLSESNQKKLPLEFQKELYKRNSHPWLLSTGEDFRWPTTKGQRPSAPARMMQAYADSILYLSPHSKLAAKSFQEMMQMTRSPLVLFHPKLMVQLLMRKMKLKI